MKPSRAAIERRCIRRGVGDASSAVRASRFDHDHFTARGGNLPRCCDPRRTRTDHRHIDIARQWRTHRTGTPRPKGREGSGAGQKSAAGNCHVMVFQISTKSGTFVNLPHQTSCRNGHGECLIYLSPLRMN
jgi:hypothetical protein